MENSPLERKMPSSDEQRLETFLQVCGELANLKGVLQALSWDQETVMPPKGGTSRARQISTLAALHHEKLVSPVVGELLDELGRTAGDPWIRSSLHELERLRRRAVLLPRTLVRELAETASLAYQVWVEARKRSDFAHLAPWLERILQLKRMEARCLMPDGPLYDALLDDYEPGMTSGDLDRLFEETRPRLAELVERITSSSVRPRPELLRGDFPVAGQEALGRAVLSAMGFDWEAGRLDRSPHPFCAGLAPSDVRITTRYSREDFTMSLFGILHEGGHALYEQGLPTEHYGLPACEAISLGIHESQSRLWENQIGRSRTFWTFWYPRLKVFFPDSPIELDLDEFVRAVNVVRPSLIRVEADEVTYGLHVILRYELEQDLLEKRLQVSDLEEVWGDKMEEYLGIRPADSAEGALQDTHWSQGMFGYFPTYLLGNLYAAQIHRLAQASLSGLDEELRQGRMLDLREWLREKIHRLGRTCSAPELIRRMGGESLSPKFFLDYLESKFDRYYAL